MKITTRVVWGYAVLLLLLSSALLYQATAIHRLQTISGELSQITFRAAEISLKLIRQRDLVDEFCRKFFAIQDPELRNEYRAELRILRENFDAILSQVNDNAGSTGEREAIRQAITDWTRFTVDFESLTAPGASPQPLEIPAQLREDLDRLQRSVDGIDKETLRPINAAVAHARQTGMWARRVSWIVTGGALLIGGVVSLLIMRSVSRPLRRLTEGTRAIADGNFSYRLSTFEDDEFQRVASDFNFMAQRLNELDRMKKDFVSHVSHEIKSPLASMRETTELLLDGIPGNLTDRQRRLLQLNLQSNRRLSSMIENLLDLSRMEAGVMEYDVRNQDLAPLIRTAIAEFELPAGEKQVEIRCNLPDRPAIAPCDGDRIIQVMANLVGNAVKFSSPGSAVEVRVAHGSEDRTKVPSKWLNASAGLAENRDYWIVEVADRGPGVPDLAKAGIFERFRRVRSGVKAPGEGTGLGLAICRTIVTAHGGTIWVDDNPGAGSCFRFVVPCLKEGETIRRRESSPI